MRIEVGRFGEGPHVPRGPLLAYLRQFPGRRVEWNRERQVFEVRERNRRTGVDERVALVFYYDVEGYVTPGGAPPTADHVAQMIDTRDNRLRKFFRPFDQRYVDMTCLDWIMFERLGSEGFVDRVLANNRRVWEGKKKEAADTLADGWGEMRRWFPVLAHYHETGVWEPDRRVPMKAVGIDLGQGAS